MQKRDAKASEGVSEKSTKTPKATASECEAENVAVPADGDANA